MLCLGAPRLEASDLQELDAEGFSRRFKITNKLGQGGFADVLCVKDAASQQHAALKVLKASSATACMCEAGRCSHAPAQAPEVSLFREARALKHAKHSNVVELHSVVHIPKACVSDASTSKSKRDKMGSCWGILIELLQGGSLQQQVYKVMAQPHSAIYSHIDALTWASDIAAAVAHLHSLNPVIIHRDLKLENILLLKPSAQGAGAASRTRKLPVAKLTDFGLHVMIDRPPAPFFITTGEDGMPLLILQQQNGATQHQQQQQGGTDTQLLRQQDLTVPDIPTGSQQQQQQVTGDAVSTAATGDQDSLTASNGSTPDAFAVADAEARVAPTGSKSSSTAKGPFISALKSTQQQPQVQSQDSQSRPKHVAFALQASTCAAEAADIAAAADTAALTVRTQAQLQRQSPGPASSDTLPAPQPRQWTRLTAGTLRRLSMDSYRSHSGSTGCPAKSDKSGGGSGSVRRPSMEQRVIPLMLEAPASGQSSFVNAAVPTLACTTEETEGIESAAGAGPDAGAGPTLMTVGSPKHRPLSSSSGSSSVAAESAHSGGVEGIGDGSISSILAAANSQRDYEVNLKPAQLAAQHLAAHRKAGSAPNYARSSASDVGGGGPASQGAEEVEGTHGTPSVCGMSVRSGEWPTAASMMWEDLMEDEVDQELLLDGGMPAVGGGHGGAMIELPLSYNLTGHTGSFMYMAPEVYKRKPYNESVDVFSMGVMFYELFSRTLLIYTHTPANKPSDCEHYASQIAEGFRPKHVKLIPPEVWDIIEACWDQDPTARPAASEVLHKLQKLLQQAQAEAAGKGTKGFGKFFGRSTQEQAPATPTGSDTEAETAATAAGKAGSAAAQPQGAAVEAGRQQRPRAEPACGCVIC